MRFSEANYNYFRFGCKQVICHLHVLLCGKRNKTITGAFDSRFFKAMLLLDKPLNCFQEIECTVINLKNYLPNQINVPFYFFATGNIYT